MIPPMAERVKVVGGVPAIIEAEAVTLVEKGVSSV